jgi:hypothetical protein
MVTLVSDGLVSEGWRPAAEAAPGGLAPEMNPLLVAPVYLDGPSCSNDPFDDFDDDDFDDEFDDDFEEEWDDDLGDSEYADEFPPDEDEKEDGGKFKDDPDFDD